MTYQQDGAAMPSRNRTKLFHQRTNAACAVHVFAAEVCLHRVDD
jgi:hypothetical protein